ncbi:hypothetical protein HMPREF3213_01626 [Heyndrickxia coagulans]|uniref:Uncharacterized protein n=1 Tax=Heyndrickxia coagulans TaxID=1398 RepID=A0A133KSX6_HEYCO|nr:hypothetical protein HMPREF3213_01626 [Heyndrickxia coagulans]
MILCSLSYRSFPYNYCFFTGDFYFLPVYEKMEFYCNSIFSRHD